MHKLVAFVGEDDSDIIPFFLDHYRRLGVGEFHLVLHGSWSERELKPLQAADVVIEDFNREPFDVVMKTSALQALAERFAGEWIFVADADEFLELPYSSLARTVAALECLGIEELPANLLQRAAPDGRLLSLADGEPEALFPCYDYRLAERMGVARPIWKSKYPLVRVGPRFWLSNGNHFPSNGHAVAHLPIRGVAHHYKWRDRLAQSIARVRGEGSNQHEQDTYRRWLEGHDGRLPTVGLRPCSRSALIEDGHLIRPTRAELRLGAALRRARHLSNAAAKPTPRQLTQLQKTPHAVDQSDPALDRHLDRRGLFTPPGRIAIVTSDLLGLRRTGGIGTAMSALAERLAAVGHEVSIFLSPFGDFPNWHRSATEYWEARGCRIHYLRPKKSQGRHAVPQAVSFALAETLSAGDWDLIHFPDAGGFAAATLMLRAAGLAFQSSQIVVTTHGPTQWHKRGNLLPWTDGEALNTDIEAMSLEFADAVISPSAYMAKWCNGRYTRLARQTVIPNSLAGEARCFGRRPTGLRSIDKIVFFGRIEVRKGIDRFLAAIENVLARGARGFEVVFLGSFAPSFSALELTRKTEGWPCSTQVLANYTSHEAIDLLRAKGCIAVLPSRADNSPYTVYECLENAIPFIASDVGGVAELICEEDRARVLVSGAPEEIADRLVDALKNGATPAQPRFDPTLADIDLLALHGNLVAEARLSRGRTAPVASARASIVVHGPTAAASEDDLLGRWLARARSEGHEVLSSADSTPAVLNSLARSAAHDRLLFCHRSVLPDPEALLAMLAVMRATDAEAIVCGYRQPAPDGTCTIVPVFGGPPELSSQRNVYGTRLFLVGKESLLDAGGFSNDPNVAAILEWEFLNRLKASGRRVIGVPAPLASSATSAPNEPAPTPLQLGQLAEAWTEAVPANLQGFMRRALRQEGRTQQENRPPARDLKLGDLVALRSISGNRNDVRSRADEARLETGDAAKTTRERSPELWRSDSLLDMLEPADSRESWLGRLRVGGDGRLLDGSGTYAIRSQSDAADCDFLVADDLVDARQLSSIERAFEDAERMIIADSQDGVDKNSFLWLSELALAHPETASLVRQVVERGIALTTEFYGLTVPIRPELIHLQKLRRGTAAGPNPRTSSVLADADNPDPFSFSGFFFVDGSCRGGDLYFTGLDIAVEPKAGRFVAATSGPHHERAMLQIEEGAILALSFSMRFGNASASRVAAELSTAASDVSVPSRREMPRIRV